MGSEGTRPDRKSTEEADSAELAAGRVGEGGGRGGCPGKLHQIPARMSFATQLENFGNESRE